MCFAVAFVLLPPSCLAAPQDGPLIKDIRAHIHLSPAERKWLAAHHEIRARVGQWPPFMMTGKRPEGISIDYLNVIAQTHELKITYLGTEEMSWSETLQRIARGNGVDLVPAIQPSPDRMQNMRFTNPYQSLPWVIVTRGRRALCR